MNGEAILVVSGVIVAFTQFAKWAGVPDRYGPVLVLALSALGVALWALSSDPEFTRQDIWPYFAGFGSVAFAASGIYGFSRAVLPADLTRVQKPPEGAAQAPTGKM